MSDMWDLDGWAEVSCHERDGMQDDMLRPISSLTDPEGEFGSPIIFTEWGFNADHPVIRDYRVPGEGCTHYVVQHIFDMQDQAARRAAGEHVRRGGLLTDSKDGDR